MQLIKGDFEECFDTIHSNYKSTSRAERQKTKEKVKKIEETILNVKKYNYN